MSTCRFLPSRISSREGFTYRVKVWKKNWFISCREVAAEGNWEDTTGELRKAFYETLCCGMILARDPLPEDVAALPTDVEYVMNFFQPGYEPTEETNETLLTDGALIESSLHGMAEGRRFCRTESGRLGQVPAATLEGDGLAVISGAEVPYILRLCAKSLMSIRWLVIATSKASCSARHWLTDCSSRLI